MGLQQLIHTICNYALVWWLVWLCSYWHYMWCFILQMVFTRNMDVNTQMSKIYSFNSVIINFPSSNVVWRTRSWMVNTVMNIRMFLLTRMNVLIIHFFYIISSLLFSFKLSCHKRVCLGDMVHFWQWDDYLGRLVEHVEGNYQDGLHGGLHGSHDEADGSHTWGYGTQWTLQLGHDLSAPSGGSPADLSPGQQWGHTILENAHRHEK